MAMDPRKLTGVRDKLYIPVTEFSGLTPALYIKGGGSIGTNMELGITDDVAAGVLAGAAGLAANTVLLGESHLDAVTLRSATTPGTSDTTGAVLAPMVNGLMALKMNNNDESVAHLLRVPPQWDLSQDIKVSAVWATDSTTVADTVLWLVTYGAMTPNTTVLAAAATALDTVIAVDNVIGAANVIQQSPQGIIDGGSIAAAATFLTLLVEMATKAGGLAEDIHFIGLEFDFVKKFEADGDRFA